MQGSYLLDPITVCFQNQSVFVRCDSKSLVEPIRTVFLHFSGPEEISRSASPSGVFTVQTLDGEFQLSNENGEILAKTKQLQELQQILKSEVSLALIRATPEYMWLHASAAACDNAAFLLTGVSGKGKSTLVTSLCEVGWKFLSDDMLPFDATSSSVLPFPALAMRRVPNESREFLPPDRFDELKRVFVEMEEGMIQDGAARVSGLIIPEYDPEGTNELEIARGYSAAADLLEGCINFIEHDQAAIRSLCELIESIPVYRLRWFDPKRAVHSIVSTYEGLSS